MEGQSLDDIYVRVMLDDSPLKKNLNEDQKLAEKAAREMEDAFKKSKADFTVRFNDTLAKKSISELQLLRAKLQADFEKKIKLNVNSQSLDFTRTQIQLIDKQLQGVSNSSEKAGGSIKNNLLGAFAAFGGVAAIFQTIKSSIAGAFNSLRAEAGVEQAVRRTGEAAGYTAEQLKKMALDLRELSGIDDADILKGVTKQFLTFTQITGTSFKRAQEAVLDLNAVINEGEVSSLTSQSIQLGKALEDPIRGVTALSRAGVTFTEEQKKMIANFVRQNDLMGAQDVILTEIENKYGGQAKALSDASKGTLQAKEALGDLLESFGSMLINIPGVTFVIKNFTGGLQTLTRWFQGSEYAAKEFKRSLDDLRSASINVSTEDLKGKTDQFRSDLKKFNEDLIASNNAELKLKRQQFKTEGEKLRLSDTDLNILRERIKVLERSNAIANGELKAIENYDARIKKANEQWSKQGKTLGEIQDRIDFLNDVKIGFVPGDKELDKINKEIKDLSKLIDNTNEKKVSPGADEKFISKLNGSLVEYRNKITLLNEELAKLGSGGNEEKTLVLTAELSKIQKQLESAEFEIGVKVNFDSGNIDTQALMDAFAVDTNKDISSELENNLQLRLKAQEEYINQVGLLNEEAYNYSVQKIEEETQAYIDAGVAREEAQIIHDEKMKKLREQKQKEEQSIKDAQLDNIAAIGSGMKGFESLSEQLFGKQSAAYKLFATTEATIATYLAATKALETVPFPFNFAAAAGVVAAGLANVAQINSAHDGGNFIGTSKGVKKMAGGGSFTVPPGHPNDSFPLLVETDEKVRVTPAGKSDPLEISLSIVSNKLDVLNSNLLNKDFSPSIFNNLTLNGRTLVKEVAKEIKRMQKEGRRF